MSPSTTASSPGASLAPRAVVSTVGFLTAFVFLLTLEDKSRFKKSRMVAVFLGLRPRRDQSGETDKQVGITKAGDEFIRRLLVNAANYILGPFGQDCDLKRWGLKLAERGGKNARQRAAKPPAFFLRSSGGRPVCQSRQGKLVTGTGDDEVALAPLPSWPPVPSPAHCTAPLLVSTHVWVEPAARCAAVASPVSVLSSGRHRTPPSESSRRVRSRSSTRRRSNCRCIKSCPAAPRQCQA